MEDLIRALPALLKEFDENETVREAVVFAVWRKIAGESLRDHAVPYRLFQKHLIVAVTSATWKKHLEYFERADDFQAQFGASASRRTFIEFRVDEPTVLQERTKHLKSTLSDDEYEEIALEEVTPKLRHSADAIKDDNLRYQFLLAAGSCLARKKNMKK